MKDQDKWREEVELQAQNLRKSEDLFRLFLLREIDSFKANECLKKKAPRKSEYYHQKMVKQSREILKLMEEMGIIKCREEDNGQGI